MSAEKPYFNLHSSETVARDVQESNENLRQVQQANAEKGIIGTYLSRTLGKERSARRKVEEATDAYELLKDDIHEEAERYVKVYGQYEEKLASCAEELGITRKPRDINTFIDGAHNMGGSEHDDWSEAENKRAIAEAVIEDLFEDEVGSSALLPDSWEEKDITNDSVRIVQNGMTFEEARAQAEQVGANSLLRINSGTRRETVHVDGTSSGPLSFKQTWAPAAPGIKELMRDKRSNYHSDTTNFARRTEDKGSERQETTRLYAGTSFEVIPITKAAAEQYPVEIGLTLPGSEKPIAIENASANQAMRDILRKVGLGNVDSVDQSRQDHFRSMQRLREATVMLADGSSVPVLDLTKDMLTKSRKTPEKAAA